jgi:hypothetical protein
LVRRSPVVLWGEDQLEGFQSLKLFFWAGTVGRAGATTTTTMPTTTMPTTTTTMAVVMAVMKVLLL